MFIWTIGDVINLIVFVLFLLLMTVVSLSGWIKQKLCKHEHYFENGQCHAICRDCGKDLGFIGTLLDKEKANAREQNN